MSDPEQRLPPRRPGWTGIGVVLLVLLGIAWLSATPPESPTGSPSATSGPEPEAGPAEEAAPSLARVQGRVYVERPREPALGVDDGVVEPSDAAAFEAIDDDGGDDGGEGEAVEAGTSGAEPSLEVGAESEGTGEGQPASTDGTDDGAPTEGEPDDADADDDEADADANEADADAEEADADDEPAEDTDDPEPWAGPLEDTDGEGPSDRPTEPPPVDLEAPPPGSCRVIPWQSGERVGEPTPCNDDGTFEVALHPGRHGRTAFEILVSGHLRAVLEVDVPPGGLGRLPPVALGQAQRIEGQVIDGHGTPLPGIVAQARPNPDLDEPEPWRAHSAADGTFVFDTLPPGPVTLRAEAPGFAPSVVEAIAPQTDLLVTMQALVDLEGRVAGPPEALARARVRIEGSGVWPVQEHPIAPDGRFVLPQIPDGIYALEAVVEATEPGQAELASIPLENVTPELSVALALVPAHRVPVEVRDPDGQPVPGARVTLSNASLGLLPKIALTDELGHVDSGPVVPGPYVLRAHADGFLPSTPIAVTVDGPVLETQVLVLPRPGRITGRVIDEDGVAVAMARVEMTADHLFTAGEGETRARFARAALRAAGSLGVTTGPVPEVPTDPDQLAEELGSSVLTDEEGGFTFDMLTPGEYRLVASHGRYATSEEVTVELGPAGTHEGLRLVLRTGHRLTGRVRDGNDRPVPGAWIRFADGRRAVTDERGVFDGGIRRGPQRMVVSANGLATQELTVHVRDEPVDVEIVLGPAGARLSGRVRGGNGEPLADARVTLRTLDGLTPTRVEWTDAYGAYHFDDLPPGEVEIEIDHPEHGPVTRRADLRRADDDAEVDVELRRGWAIEIEVLAEATREPLRGVAVEGGGHRDRTNDDGIAVLDRLMDDRVRVQVSAPGHGTRTLWIERDGADRQHRRVELAEGGGVSGRVIDYRGDPIPGVEVLVHDAAGAELGRVRTDARGEFSLPAVPAGDVVVSADPPRDREDELAPDAQSTDVLRGHVTKGVTLRFDRR